MTSPSTAAVYLPVRRVEGRAVRGADEDAFTLAAAAVERVVAGLPAPERWELVATGEARGIPEQLFSQLLGTAVHCRETSASSSESSSRPTLHVAVDLSGSMAGGEDRAVAFRGEAIAGASPATSSRSASDRLYAELQRLRPEEIVRLGGDRPTSDPAGGGPTTSTTPAEQLGRVSEGALLPRARYLEGIPSHWRLEGEDCGGCGRVGFPARGRCRGCGRSDRLAPHRFPLDGHSVVAVTRIGPGAQPTEFDAQVEGTGGYQVILAELGPNARATLQTTDPEVGPLSIGDRVATVLRRTYAMEGEWRYARKAHRLSDVG